MDDYLYGLTIPQLKDLCRILELRIGGNKGDLAKRIWGADLLPVTISQMRDLCWHLGLHTGGSKEDLIKSFEEQIGKQKKAKKKAKKRKSGLVDYAEAGTRVRCVECDHPTEGGSRRGTYLCTNCGFMFDSHGNAI